MIKLTPIEKKVNKEINGYIKKIICEKIDKIIGEINKKTFIYSILSLVGFILIFFPLPKIIFYISFVIIFMIFCYLLNGSLKLLKSVLNWIENFDDKIKNLTEKNLQAIRKESLKKRMGLWLSGHNNEDIENLALSYSIRELARQVKNKKKDVVVRVLAYYAITWILFNRILMDIFILFR